MVRRFTITRRGFSLTSSFALFAGGLITGFIVLPIALPIAGYQLQKRYGPPAEKRR
jgi:hypothetical protein